MIYIDKGSVLFLLRKTKIVSNSVAKRDVAMPGQCSSGFLSIRASPWHFITTNAKDKSIVAYLISDLSGAEVSAPLNMCIS
jgi:hypothetical protein